MRTYDQVCGNCKYNCYEYKGHGVTEFFCGNEESENSGCPTRYGDTCDEFEEKGE